jgi:hypothetical protein
MKSKSIIIQLVIFIFSYSIMYQSNTYASSCCGLSSTLVSSGHPALNQNQFLILNGYDYSRTENEAFSRGGISFGLAYGLTSKLAFSIRTNFNIFRYNQFRPGLYLQNDDNTIEVLKADTTFKFKNQGFGDGLIGVQYTLVPLTLVTKQELKIGADAVIPWATFDKKVHIDGMETLLPAQVQNGNGVFSFGGFVSYNKSLPIHRIAFTTMLAGRVKIKNKNGVTPGNDANILVSSIFGPYFKTKGIISINYKASRQSRDSADTKDSLTGGRRLDIIPAIDIAFNDHFKIAIDTELPLWRDKNQKTRGPIFGTHLNFLIFI